MTMYQFLFPIVAKQLENIQYGELRLHTPDGREHVYSGNLEGPKGIVHILDWSVFSGLIFGGDIKLAHLYHDNSWDTPDLEELIKFYFVNSKSLHTLGQPSWINNLVLRFRDRLRRNSLKGSPKNISYHYDLGNEFYGMWLDPSMTYSSALYQGKTKSLRMAQEQKNRRILNLIEKPGRLLDVGCGWGSFTSQAIQEGDHDADGITISKEQHSYATQRIAKISKSKGKILLKDYRKMTNVYDSIVSIEMFEAVGEQYWPVYFQKLSSLLRKGGKFIAQIITIPDREMKYYLRSSDFIRSYIFPGGALTSEEIVRYHAKKAGLHAFDCFHFPKDYVKTLQTWRKRFNEQSQSLLSAGYDESFQRLWNMYLASCAVGFDVGRTSVMQIAFEKV